MLGYGYSDLHSLLICRLYSNPVFVTQKAEHAKYLNHSSEEWRHDKYVLPPDQEGGVRVEGEPVQPRHQVQVPHLHILMAIITCKLVVWVAVILMRLTSRLVVCGSKTATLQLSECS